MFGGGGEHLPVRYPADDAKLQNMEGFSVELRGYDPSDDIYARTLGDFQRGLKHYKKRAQRVMPWLLKYKLPFVLHFAENRRLMSSGPAATYGGDHINFNLGGMSGQPSDVAKVLAHEMGHHIYKSVLSGKMRDDWNNLVLGNYMDLDLRDVLKLRDKHGDGFEDNLERTHPILALQLMTLENDPSYKNLKLWSFDRIQKYVDRGENPILRVPAKPISGYAAKNPEEAFCEALGLLVGYGPRAVLPVYRGALKILFPKLKIESVGRPSARLKEAIVL